MWLRRGSGGRLLWARYWSLRINEGPSWEFLVLKPKSRRGCPSYPALGAGQVNETYCCTDVCKVTKCSVGWTAALRSCVPHSEGWNEYYFPEMGNWIRMNSLPRIEFQMAVVTIHGRKGYYIPEGLISLPPRPSSSVWSGTPFPGNHRFWYRLLKNFSPGYLLTACCGCALSSILKRFVLGTPEIVKPNVPIPPGRGGLTKYLQLN